MSRKTASNKTQSDDQVETMEEKIVTGAEPEKVPESEEQDNQQPMESDNVRIVLSGKARKLSPKSTSHVHYELVVLDDTQLYLRLTKNETTGLFSKENVPMKAITEILDKQDDKSFKSSLFRVYKGGSSNNMAFCASAIRDLQLITNAEPSIFLHKLSDRYAERRDEILALIDAEPVTKTTA